MNEETNRSFLKKKRWESICKEDGKCPICPIHDGENRRRRQRSDKYKNKDREKPNIEEMFDSPLSQNLSIFNEELYV